MIRNAVRPSGPDGIFWYLERFGLEINDQATHFGSWNARTCPAMIRPLPGNVDRNVRHSIETSGTKQLGLQQV